MLQNKKKSKSLAKNTKNKFLINAKDMLISTADIGSCTMGI